MKRSRREYDERACNGGGERKRRARQRELSEIEPLATMSQLGNRLSMLLVYKQVAGHSSLQTLPDSPDSVECMYRCHHANRSRCEARSRCFYCTPEDGGQKAGNWLARCSSLNVTGWFVHRGVRLGRGVGAVRSRVQKLSALSACLPLPPHTTSTTATR